MHRSQIWKYWIIFPQYLQQEHAAEDQRNFESGRHFSYNNFSFCLTIISLFSHNDFPFLAFKYPHTSPANLIRGWTNNIRPNMHQTYLVSVSDPLKLIECLFGPIAESKNCFPISGRFGWRVKVRDMKHPKGQGLSAHLRGTKNRKLGFITNIKIVFSFPHKVYFGFCCNK